jgi:hypothetical protein
MTRKFPDILKNCNRICHPLQTSQGRFLYLDLQGFRNADFLKTVLPLVEFEVEKMQVA